MHDEDRVAGEIADLRRRLEDLERSLQQSTEEVFEELARLTNRLEEIENAVEAALGQHYD